MLTKQKGSEAKGRNVTPPSMDSGSKASTYGKAKGHANHWAKPRRCPRRLVKKGRGDRVIHPLRQARDESEALRIEGPARADSQDDEAHVRGEIPLLVAA